MTPQEFIEGLRRVADFYEAHPDLRMPGEGRYNADWFVWVDTKDELAAFARAFGVCRKDLDGGYAAVTAKLGEITLRAITRKENVCEQVVVGTKKVTKRIQDPSVVVPMVEVEVEEDILEWRCPESLLELQDEVVSK